MKSGMRAATSLNANAIAIPLCALLDGALAFWLLTDPPSARSLATTLGAHLVVSLAAGFALAGVMPEFVKASRRDVIATGALIATFIPAIGLLGMFIAIRFGLTELRPRNREPWVVFDLRKDLEEQHRRPRVLRQAGVSALEIRTALRQRTDDTVAYRFQSVLAIQKLPPKVGVPLLKVAQSDPSDEIRLYAFSRLERMRDGLEKQVKELTASLATAGKEEAARLHLRLAQSYFELGYLGLAEGAVLDHALKSAHRHAAVSCELMPMNAPAEFFLGRILLYLRDPQRAEIAFARAIKAGYPRVKILPWLAECAFYEREFAAVRALLRELEAASPENVFFQPVSDFWAGAHSERPPPPPGSRKSLQIGSERSMPRVRPS